MRRHCPTQRQDSPKLGLQQRAFPIASSKRLVANRKNASATSDTASRLTQIGLAANPSSLRRASPSLPQNVWVPIAKTRRRHPTQRRDSPNWLAVNGVSTVEPSHRLLKTPSANCKNASATSDTASRLTQIGLAAKVSRKYSFFHIPTSNKAAVSTIEPSPSPPQNVWVPIAKTRRRRPTQRRDSPKLGLQQNSHLYCRGFSIASSNCLGANRKNALATSDTAPNFEPDSLPLTSPCVSSATQLLF
ncbi:hypothetical protein B0H12DRAFT_1227246 [Mycena haematopus]|nr:hypothetical protein B0H12DRAFT_1227246 [Mycena haematopus]